MKQAPGPQGSEVIKAMLGKKKSALALIGELHERFGETVRIKIGDTQQFVTGNLDGIKHVLVDNHRNYSKGPAYELLAGVLGKGLVTSEGDHWKKQRKIIQPVFQRERLRIFSKAMVECALREVADLETKTEADIYTHMMDLALTIVSRTVLGTGLDGQEGNVHESFTNILDYIASLSTSKLRFFEFLPGGSRFRGLRKWATKLPSERRTKFLAAVEVLDSLIYGVISRRKAELIQSGPDSTALDLITMLLQAKDESGAPAMTDEEIRDETMTLFLAGHETTATALTWTFYLLAKNPQYHRKIQAEVQAVLEDRMPTLEDLPKLTMCQWVIEESMRLYPPVWRLSRFAKDQDEIQGYTVPAGSVVVLTPYFIHRDPRYWERPDAFEPERFSPERSAGRPRLAFVPFGAGPRACIGAMFAMAEAQIILAVICRKLFFELPPDFQLELEPLVMLRPKKTSLGVMPMKILGASRAPKRGSENG